MTSTLMKRRFAATLTAFALASAIFSGVPLLNPPAANAEPGRPATLVGDLQNELSCGADWDPACSQTRMIQSPEDPNLYEFVATIPAGSWKFKVAMDGEWKEAYGKDGFPDNNVPLILQAPTEVAFTFDYSSKNIGIRLPQLPGAFDPAADASLIQTPATHPGAGQQFYFVLTDRFANGDAANDHGASTSTDRLTTGFDPTDKAFYHGGDLKGLTQKLDYIKNLGTTAIWLTPSFTNMPVLTDAKGENPSAGYHGYWITDFTTIDPHLGSNEDLKALISAAHDKGMKVYFDIVVNHTADLIKYREGDGKIYRETADYPYKTAAGIPFTLSEVAGSDAFPALSAEKSFPYTPYRPEGNDIMKPEWLNDVTLYHNRGDSTWTGESTTLGDFIGLDDLMTENPTVIKGMADIYKTWIDLGLDGFRIDTVKHVDNTFWTQWSKQIAQHAQTSGKEEFFTFGEVYSFEAAELAPYTRDTSMNAVLDFMFQNRAVKFAKGDSTQVLADLFAADDLYTTPSSNAGLMPTFLGNHDMGRVGFLVNGVGSGVERSKLAHSLMYLTRGQPVVYYGDEQGFVGLGDGTDKEARQDMFATATEHFATQKLLNGETMGKKDRFDEQNPLYTHIAALSKLRQSHRALNTGAQIERWVTQGPGMYAFSRVDRDEKIEYLVAVNNSGAPVTQKPNALTSNATFTPLYGADSPVSSDAQGAVSITVPAYGAVVYKADSRVDAGAVTGGLTVAGHKLSGRAPIGTNISGDQWSETSFSFRLAGDKAWTPLGVDTGQDARVYHDVSALPVGTVVEYRAVTTDAAGASQASSGWGVVGVDLVGGPTTGPDVSTMVTIPGTFNKALGCVKGADGDWDPSCEKIALTKDANSPWYTGTFTIPAGEHKYKIAVGGSWAENYGKNKTEKGAFTVAREGSDVVFTSTGEPITFYYNPVTHYFFNTVEHDPITLPGDFTQGLGCTGGVGGNWDPACLTTLMERVDADTFTFTTDALAGRQIEIKAAHKLDWKESYGPENDRGGNYRFTIPAGQRATFTYTLSTHNLALSTKDLSSIDSTNAEAQWIDEATIALPASLFKGNFPGDATVELLAAPDGRVSIVGNAPVSTVGKVESITLERVGAAPTAEQLMNFRHLFGYSTYALPAEQQAHAKKLLKGALHVAVKAKGVPVSLTGVQTPGVLDALYATKARSAKLGVTWEGAGTGAATPTLNLWAPTATKVEAELWDNSTGEGAAREKVGLTLNPETGIWSVIGQPAWKNNAYRFLVDVYVPSEGKIVTNTVTDPYSVGLAVASTHSVLLDMKDPALAPASWTSMTVPSIPRAVDQMIYELHVRDFSINDTTVPENLRGTYKAFTQTNSAGMKHLAEVGAAGVNAIHLLPTFDIATIPEPRSAQTNPMVPSAGADHDEQQAAVTAAAATDGFNWGYDPYHYFAPEGSYASDPSAPGRVKEYREMVAALAGLKMRVIADQVFNHTAQSGQDEKSVLDKIVPGYYHRLNWQGMVEKSTCCENIATEHQMSEQLMIDSVLTWARDYKVSGFRFDLMGHHSASNLTTIQSRLRELTLEKDGIDGSTIHMYGEGWNFGEVANNARFDQATQGQLGGTQIGSFNDRLRDGVHGEGLTGQGWGTGQAMEVRPGNDGGHDVGKLRHQSDLIRIGLAGNLKSFRFLASDGVVKTGADLRYGASPAGYADDPADSVNYVDAHDNQTLYDITVMRMPQSLSMADRVRMNTVQLATVALGQSPAFWHAGTDLMRSKSLDRDSYNSGDHFNAIDWSGQTHNFGVGLPPAEKNQSNWDYQTPLLRDPALKASPADLATSKAMALDLIRLRYASPLMRLGSAELINERVTFPAAGPHAPAGLIVMHIDDRMGTDIDPKREAIMAVFNPSPAPITHKLDGFEGRRFALSTIQREGVDPVVKTTSWDEATGTITIPARTVAVLDGLPSRLADRHTATYAPMNAVRGLDTPVVGAAPVDADPAGSALPEKTRFALTPAVSNPSAAPNAPAVNAPTPEVAASQARWVAINADTGALTLSPGAEVGLGEHTVFVTATYSDGSSESVPVAVTVAASQAEGFTPAYGPLSLNQGAHEVLPAPLAPEGALPERTSFTAGASWVEWAELTDTGQIIVRPGTDVAPGDYQLPVIVTYPDTSTDQVNLAVTVTAQPLNAKHLPGYAPLTVVRGLSEATTGATPTDVAPGGAVLPAGTTFALVDSTPEAVRAWLSVDTASGALSAHPDASVEAGEYLARVKVTFSDSSEASVTAAVTVVLNSAEKYTPRYAAATVTQGHEAIVAAPTAAEGALPEGTQFRAGDGWPAWAQLGADGAITLTPDQEVEAGAVTLNVVVDYADGSSATAQVNVMVVARPTPQAELYAPAYSPIEVTRGLPMVTTTPAPTNTSSAGEALPAGIAFALADADTSAQIPAAPEWVSINAATGVLTLAPGASVEVGPVAFGVRVTYVDGSEETIRVAAEVRQAVAEQKAPAYAEATTKAAAGATLRITQTNLELPAGVTAALMDTSVIPQGWTVTVTERSIEGSSIPAGQGASLRIIPLENLDLARVGDIQVVVPADAKPGDRALIRVLFTYPDGSTAQALHEVAIVEDSTPNNPGDTGSQSGNGAPGNTGDQGNTPGGDGNSNGGNGNDGSGNNGAGNNGSGNNTPGTDQGGNGNSGSDNGQGSTPGGPTPPPNVPPAPPSVPNPGGNPSPAPGGSGNGGGGNAGGPKPGTSPAGGGATPSANPDGSSVERYDNGKNAPQVKLASTGTDGMFGAVIGLFLGGAALSALRRRR